MEKGKSVCHRGRLCEAGRKLGTWWRLMDAGRGTGVGAIYA